MNSLTFHLEEISRCDISKSGYNDCFNDTGDIKFLDKYKPQINKIWDEQQEHLKITLMPLAQSDTTSDILQSLIWLQNTQDKKLFMEKATALFHLNVFSHVCPMDNVVTLPLFDKENNCFKNIRFDGVFFRSSTVMDIHNFINDTLPDTPFRSELEPNKRYFKEVTSLLYDETQKNTVHRSLQAYLSFLRSCTRAQYDYLVPRQKTVQFNLTPQRQVYAFGIPESEEFIYDIMSHPNVRSIERTDKRSYNIHVKDLKKRPASEPPQHANYQLIFKDERSF